MCYWGLLHIVRIVIKVLLTIPKKKRWKGENPHKGVRRYTLFRKRGHQSSGKKSPTRWWRVYKIIDKRGREPLIETRGKDGQCGEARCVG